jgi:hypothetical protein
LYYAKELLGRTSEKFYEKRGCHIPEDNTSLNKINFGVAVHFLRKKIFEVIVIVLRKEAFEVVELVLREEALKSRC